MVTKRTLRGSSLSFNARSREQQQRRFLNLLGLHRRSSARPLRFSRRHITHSPGATFSEEFEWCVEYCAKLGDHFHVSVHWFGASKAPDFRCMFGKYDRVSITSDEIAIRSVHAASQIRLLGFKPRQLVKPHHQLEHPTFLYPDDDHLQGSLVALVALHRRMLSRGVVAICAVKMRPRSEERLAA